MESHFANEFQIEAKDRLPSDAAATGSHGFHQESHNWSSSSPSSSSSISSADPQDLFEFFSGDHHHWSTSNLFYPHVAPADNILFCGKLFPSKQPISMPNDPKFCHSTRTIISPTSNVGLFRRNYSVPNSYYMPRSKSSAASTSNDHSRIPRSMSVPVPRNGSLARRSGGKKDNTRIVPKARDDHSISKWTTKSRWFVFMFGMSSPGGGAAKEMELSDLRSRLINHHRSPSVLFPTTSDGDHDHQLVGGNIGKSCFSFRCFGGIAVKD